MLVRVHTTTTVSMRRLCAFFSRSLHRPLSGAEFRFTGMFTKPIKPRAGMFDGDENAIVDFKYSANPRLTWCSTSSERLLTLRR